MKKKLLLLVGIVAVAVVAGVIAWSPQVEAMPSCESRCERQFDKCLRQGNDYNFCFDQVFCECMCNTCDDCVC